MSAENKPCESHFTMIGLAGLAPLILVLSLSSIRKGKALLRNLTQQNTDLADILRGSSMAQVAHHFIL
ncbi:hypothetical protein K461DRAFT_282256 [Myriangium duriaei CBS 260.36]|uniref:Uncharacterized protein n=1 Tax=Myriangium duriaei CBS 260.36 TaxID=1168546 RepID=A0A9P4IRN8_9PEZI|nr:hypothetical protein K461DRAFT_282256 [Myriangium duriaei CBS 260.36]